MIRWNSEQKGSLGHGVKRRSSQVLLLHSINQERQIHDAVRRTKCYFLLGHAISSLQVDEGFLLYGSLRGSSY